MPHFVFYDSANLLVIFFWMCWRSSGRKSFKRFSTCCFIMPLRLLYLWVHLCSCVRWRDRFCWKASILGSSANLVLLVVFVHTKVLRFHQPSTLTFLLLLVNLTSISWVLVNMCFSCSWCSEFSSFFNVFSSFSLLLLADCRVSIYHAFWLHDSSWFDEASYFYAYHNWIMVPVDVSFGISFDWHNELPKSIFYVIVVRQFKKCWQCKVVACNRTMVRVVASRIIYDAMFSVLRVFQSRAIGLELPYVLLSINVGSGSVWQTLKNR